MAGKRKRAAEAEEESAEETSSKEETQEEEETEKKAKKTKKKETTKKAPAKKATATKGAAKKGSKPTIKNESEARPMILEYLKNQNRPYSLQQVIDNMGGQIKKAMVTKCLDKLEGEGELIMKANGKQKMWFRNQADLEVLSKEELKQIDIEIRDIQKELAGYKISNQELTAELNKLSKAPTTEELKKMIDKEKQDLANRREKLERLENGSIKLVSPQEKKDAVAGLEKYLKEWRKRKETAMTILLSFADNAEMKPADLIEEIGIDTDESVHVDIKTIGKLNY